MKVAVVGGGIVGTCVTRELGMRGVSVTLFEASRALGEGTTAAAIGGISPLSDDFVRGTLAPVFRDIFASFWRTIDGLNVGDADIDLIRNGMLYLALSEAEGDRLQHTYAAELPPEYVSIHGCGDVSRSWVWVARACR